MRQFLLITLVFCVSMGPVVFAAELLTEEEQSFETGPAPGRWTAFTWGQTTGVQDIPPSAFGDHENDQVSGDPITVTTAANTGLSGWGTSALHLVDTVSSSDHADVGGIYINLPVVNGATYTISGNVFLPNVTSAYLSALGMSVDTNGSSTNPKLADYGIGRSANTGKRKELDLNRGVTYATGDWLWNETFAGSNEGVWIGPDQFTLDIQATGNNMTIYIWGLSKWHNLDALVDGVSVQGPLPDVPTPVPPASASDWEAVK